MTRRFPMRIFLLLSLFAMTAGGGEIPGYQNLGVPPGLDVVILDDVIAKKRVQEAAQKIAFVANNQLRFLALNGDLTPAGVTSFPIPCTGCDTGAARFLPITGIEDASGNVWMTGRVVNAGTGSTIQPLIVNGTPAGGFVTIPGAVPTLFDSGTPGVTPGDVGSVWWTIPASHRYVRRGATGQLLQLATPGLDSPGRITSGAPDDPNVYMTARGGFVRGDDKACVKITLPGNPQPDFITTGPDWVLLMTDTESDNIFRSTPNGDSITRFPVPGCGPAGLQVGPDGKLYVGCTTSRQILQLDLQTGATAASDAPIAPRGLVIAGTAADFRIFFSGNTAAGTAAPLHVARIAAQDGPGPDPTGYLVDNYFSEDEYQAPVSESAYTLRPNGMVAAGVWIVNVGELATTGPVNVDITATGATFSGTQPAGCAAAGATLRCTVGPIAPGERKNIEPVAARVGGGAGTVTLALRVSGGGDVNEANNTSAIAFQSNPARAVTDTEISNALLEVFGR